MKFEDIDFNKLEWAAQPKSIEEVTRNKILKLNGPKSGSPCHKFDCNNCRILMTKIRDGEKYTYCVGNINNKETLIEFIKATKIFVPFKNQAEIVEEEVIEKEVISKYRSSLR